jgi:hypothetical protein
MSIKDYSKSTKRDAAVADSRDAVEADDDDRAPPTERKVVEPATEFERKLATYSKIGVPVLTVLGTLIAAKLQGPPLAVLVLASGVLIGVITALWASLRALLGETPLTGADAYVIAAPRSEEEQKRAVLRALKDIEFERSVGKITEADYRELSTRYREEAKRLLRFLDEEAGPRRAAVEELVAKRLRDIGLAEKDGAENKSEPSDAEPAEEASAELERRDRRANKKKRKKARPEAAARETAPVADPANEADEPKDDGEADDGPACVDCGTLNDEDAVFCKKCGKKQVFA